MPTNGRWQGTLDRAFHRVDDDSVAVDVVLVVDGKDPDAPIVRGHLEGAVTGEFAARYCDALVGYNTWFPS